MKNWCVYIEKNNIITKFLKNIDLIVKKGEFIAISGKIESGKSLLFSSILG